MSDELKEKIKKLKELTEKYHPYLLPTDLPDENRTLNNMMFAANCKMLILDVIKGLEYDREKM